jgi:hypothetical protein
MNYFKANEEYFVKVFSKHFGEFLGLKQWYLEEDIHLQEMEDGLNNDEKNSIEKQRDKLYNEYQQNCKSLKRKCQDVLSSQQNPFNKIPNRFNLAIGKELDKLTYGVPKQTYILELQSQLEKYYPQNRQDQLFSSCFHTDWGNINMSEIEKLELATDQKIEKYYNIPKGSFNICKRRFDKLLSYYTETFIELQNIYRHL